MRCLCTALHTAYFTGGWTFALKDYYSLNFTMHLDDPAVAQMMTIIDPLVYVDRYEGIPKLVIDAGGDEFFLPDDEAYWWTSMTEPKHMLQVFGSLLPACLPACLLLSPLLHQIKSNEIKCLFVCCAVLWLCCAVWCCAALLCAVAMVLGAKRRAFACHRSARSHSRSHCIRWR